MSDMAVIPSKFVFLWFLTSIMSYKHDISSLYGRLRLILQLGLVMFFGFVGEKLAAQVPVADTVSLTKPAVVPDSLQRLKKELVDVPKMVDSSATALTEIDSIRPFDTLAPTGVYNAETFHSSGLTGNNPLDKVKLSESALDDQVNYESRDTQIYDLDEETVYLYGAAKVEYDGLTLTADYIKFNWGNNEVIAEGVRDTITGQLTGIPVFTDPNQTFEAKKIRFNFKTRKGIISNVVTKQGTDLFVLGQKAKITSIENDTAGRTDIVYSENAIFTTCDHPHPHFGIRSKKQKVIANKVVVVGPSNLELGGIPTPLWLPFGVYPLNNAGSSGLLFPKDFDQTPSLGLGLKDVGWYFPFGKYVNLQATADIYLRGSWGVNARSQYRKKYWGSGTASLGFRVTKTENLETGLPQKDTSISIIWSHSQDSKAHPYNTFSANVNIQSQRFEQQFNQSAATQQRNQYQSSISYNRSFRNKPWKFSASGNVSQNTRDSTISIRAPQMTFTVGNFRPFKSKGSKKKWYDNLSFNYRAETSSNVKTKTADLFKSETLDEIQTGMRHTFTASFNVPIFDFFNFNISTGFNENIYLKNFERNFVENIDTVQIWEPTVVGGEAKFVRADTISFGSIEDQFNNQLTFFHNLKTTSAGLSTKVFATTLFKKGALRGLRNVTTPSVNMSYTPGHAQFFGEVVNRTANGLDTLTYNRLQGALYDKPSSAVRNLSFNYSIRNTLEAKIYSRKTKKDKNVKIIENFDVSGGYNYALDSLNWTNPRFSARTNFLKRSINVKLASTLRLYERDEETRNVVDKLLLKEKGKLFEYDRTTLTVTSRTTVRTILDLIQGNEKPGKGAKGTLEALLEGFAINHNIEWRWENATRDTFLLNRNVMDIRGGLNITDKWNVTVSQIGYDFIQKKLTYPDFTFSRDLHCWAMSVSWRPVFNSFTFNLSVKPGSTLEFIKVPYKQRNFSGDRFGPR